MKRYRKSGEYPLKDHLREWVISFEKCNKLRQVAEHCAVACGHKKLSKEI